MKNITYNLRDIPLIGFLGTIKYYLFVEGYYRFLCRFGKRRGISDCNRDIPLIVSLTSFSARFKKLPLCIESLLRQTVKPDQIILWLAEADKDIPRALEKLQNRGLTIKYCKDIRSYKKIIFALSEYPEAIIVTADDDLLYPKNWLAELYFSYCNAPEFIHCHRAHLMTLNADGILRNYKNWKYGAPGFLGPSALLFPTGAGGILYPPGYLNQQVFNEGLFMELAPTGDDIWLKAMSLLNNIKCKKIHPEAYEFIQIKGTQNSALWRENTERGKNDTQIKAVFQHFNLSRIGESDESSDQTTKP